jgi:predicted DNA repair protein MutK
MAGTSLLTLIDDIASTLDDIAALTKVATQKTAGVLGDDLALNAQQVSGVSSDRELHIVYAVAKGSALNKVILVPLALIIAATSQTLVSVLLMAGGLFLCFEGFEKVFEKILKFFLKKKSYSNHEVNELKKTNSLEFEKEKIKGAVRTDFILSAEIIVITLGTLEAANLLKQFLVLSSVSAIMTIGVYGLVAIIVKLDDMGLYLSRPNKSRHFQIFGRALLWFAPNLMKFLGVAGTVAMFLVGGGILTHGISSLHHLKESLGNGGIAIDLATGILGGGLAALIWHFVNPLLLKIKKSSV